MFSCFLYYFCLLSILISVKAKFYYLPNVLTLFVFLHRDYTAEREAEYALYKNTVMTGQVR